MSTNRSRSRAAQDAEAARQRAPVTDRVNVEPAILNGMTMTEAQVIGGIALAVFLVIGGLVFTITGFWQVWLLLAFAGPTLTLWYGSQYLVRLKRGRPDAFYTQSIHLWLASHGLAKPKFITHHGWWSIGRSLDLSLASPLEPEREEFPKS